MSVLVVGMSHRTAPVSLLERVSVSGDALVKLLHDVHRDECVAETMVVSTCNRVEVYADVDRFHGGVNGVTEQPVARPSNGVPPQRSRPGDGTEYRSRQAPAVDAEHAPPDATIFLPTTPTRWKRDEKADYH